MRCGRPLFGFLDLNDDVRVTGDERFIGASFGIADCDSGAREDNGRGAR